MPCTQEETEVLIEITISNLRADGDIDERDFLDRVDVLGKLDIQLLFQTFQNITD
jgi:hypothetical protein